MKFLQLGQHILDIRFVLFDGEDFSFLWENLMLVSLIYTEILVTR